MMGVNEIKAVVPVGADSHSELENSETSAGGFCLANELNQGIKYLAC
jgi:hypothetical protein